MVKRGKGRKKRDNSKRKERERKKGLFDYITAGFSNYFNNLYIVLPMLLFFLISIILGIIVMLPFIKTILPLININQSQGISMDNVNSDIQISQLFPSLTIFFIVIGVVGLVLTIFYFIFKSSTLEFAKNIVKKSEKGKGFKYYFKKSFSYAKRWLSLLGLYVILSLIFLPYLALIFALGYLLRHNLIIAIIIVILLFIILLFLSLFILPAPYVLFYYDSSISKSISISIKNIKENYWDFFLLNLLILLIIFSINFIFSLFGFGFVIRYFFATQYIALVIMEFIKDRFKEKI